MKNLLPIALLIGGIYLVSQQQKRVYNTNTPKNEGGNINVVNWFYNYDCNSLKINNKEKFSEFVKEAEVNAFNSLKLPVDSIFDFSKHVIPFASKVINQFTTTPCDPKKLSQNGKIIYYILAAEAIDDLIKMKLGNEINIDSEEFQKWKDVSDSYYDILSEYLGLQGKELEINAAYEKLSNTNQFP